MADTCRPELTWWQTLDKVLVKIRIDAATNAKVELKDNKLEFSGTSGDNRQFAISFDFFAAVDEAESKWSVEPSSVDLLLKKGDETWWKNLNSGRKIASIKADLINWKSKKDLKAPAGGAISPPGGMDFGGMDFSSMMGGMGGMGGMPDMSGMDFGGEDDDDDGEEEPQE